MSANKKRGRPRRVPYVRMSSLIPKYVEALTTIYETERIILPLHRITHDVIQRRLADVREDPYGNKTEVFKTEFLGQVIQCPTCGAQFTDPEFVVDDEKFKPKLRRGRLILRLDCGHRMDVWMPKTRKFNQLSKDRYLKMIGWTPDKSCEKDSGVPTVRTVRAFADKLTEEDLKMILKLRPKRESFVELSTVEKDKGLWSKRKKRNKIRK